MKALTALAVLLGALTLTGCEDTFKTDCTDRGGKVDTQVDYDTKTRTKTVNGKRKTETYRERDEDRFCIVDGQIVDED